MVYTPKPVGLYPSKAYSDLLKMSEYFKAKENATREQYGWDSAEAQDVRSKFEVMLEARKILVKEFDL